ncbi:hypothetical protein [Phytoactinopolyspora limicola]|uniref:hypothetical protein n=1 Tax=Phytoactinopolyspora limicola TaxID=2715536 RepID=UPI00140B5403|nr:hypothetical protein [Phytoactinopolyspora limicola]
MATPFDIDSQLIQGTLRAADRFILRCRARADWPAGVKSIYAVRSLFLQFALSEYLAERGDSWDEQAWEAAAETVVDFMDNPENWTAIFLDREPISAAGYLPIQPMDDLSMRVN